jgi:hypothetical protein
MTRWRAPEPESAPRRFTPWVAAAVLPWALLAALVARNALDVPLIDQWSFVPQIERFYTGTLTVADLWAQHGEHRLIFPRLIMLGLSSVTGWNVLYEIALDVLLATATFFLLARILRRDLAATGKPAPLWLWFVLSLAVFSLAQWENWLWGWQMQVFLNVLSATAAIVILRRPPLEWKTLAAAALLGFVATYSFGNGLLVWPIGMALVALAPEIRGRRWMHQLAWAGISLAVIASYLAGFRGGTAPPLETILIRPIAYLRYVTTFLGSPLASFSGSAWPPRDTGVAAIVGAAGVLLLFLAGGKALRRPRGEWPLGSLALAAYALASGLVVSVARFTFGTPNALASRYTTISSLFWIGTIGVVWNVAAIREKPARRLWAGAVGAIATLFIVSSLYSIPIFPARRAMLLPARAEMGRGEDVAMLQRLHPEIQQVRYALPVLRHFQLSVFRDASEARRLAESRPQRLSHFGQILRPLFRIEKVRPGQEVTVPVRVTNPTTEVWSATGDGTGALAVRLSYHWIDFAGRVVVYDGSRTSLPRDLQPGETVAVHARVASPTTPGRYRLDFTMVQEGVSWFDAASGGSAQLPVEVVP